MVGRRADSPKSSFATAPADNSNTGQSSTLSASPAPGPGPNTYESGSTSKLSSGARDGSEV